MTNEEAQLIEEVCSVEDMESESKKSTYENRVTKIEDN